MKTLFYFSLWVGVQLCLGYIALAQDAPSCTDSAGSSTSTTAHSVTLNWNASVPVSNSPKDVIKGYYIYRSSTSNTFKNSDRLNSTPLQATRCVDRSVEPGGTYFYAVASVAVSGAKSGYSVQIKAVVPSP